MEFDRILNTENIGLITYRDVIKDGRKGVHIEMDAGLTTPCMVVDKERVTVIYESGMGELLVEAILNSKLIHHRIQIPADNCCDVITYLGVGATYEFIAGDYMFLKVLVLED